MVEWKEPEPASTDSDLHSLLDQIDIMRIGNQTPLEGIYLPFNKVCREDVTKRVTIDTSSIWQFETLAGSIWRVKQITKKGKRLRSYIDEASSHLETSSLERLKKDIPVDYGTWEISIESPPVAGNRPII